MSGDNFDLVRRATDAYNRRDVDGLLEQWDPDAVLDWSNSRGPDAGVYRGHDEIRVFAEQFFSAFEEHRVDLGVPQEIEDRLVVENVIYLRGRDGIEVQARSAWVITIRDGKQASLTLYQSMDDALAAARGADSAG